MRGLNTKKPCIPNPESKKAQAPQRPGRLSVGALPQPRARPLPLLNFYIMDMGSAPSKLKTARPKAPRPKPPRPRPLRPRRTSSHMPVKAIIAQPLLLILLLLLVVVVVAVLATHGS